jgi:hypothetical protein
MFMNRHVPRERIEAARRIPRGLRLISYPAFSKARSRFGLPDRCRGRAAVTVATGGRHTRRATSRSRNGEKLLVAGCMSQAISVYPRTKCVSVT